MSILVTGAGGFLGGHVVERLLAREHPHIRCLVRSRSGRLDELRTKYPRATLEVIHGNLLSVPDLQRALAGIDTVYHVAAELKGSPADLVLNTVVGSKRLLQAAQGVRRFVLVSSFGVYRVPQVRKHSLVDENTPLEDQPQERDAYSFSKWLQEKLFRDWQERQGFELMILRPGVIYGPGHMNLSNRVGLKLPGAYMHVGGSNQLPLTHVVNCAEALAVAGEQDGHFTVLNAVDDELPTCREYLRMYRRANGKMRVVGVPLSGAMLLAKAIRAYSVHSRGQLPAVLTPYKAEALWSGTRFSNERLKQAGWRQIVPTAAGLRDGFAVTNGHRPR